MIIYDIDTGIRHYVGKDDPFGVDTICGKQIPCDRVLSVNGDYYTNCDCPECLYEIHKDLKRRPKKRPANRTKNYRGGKNVPLSV